MANVKANQVVPWLLLVGGVLVGKKVFAKIFGDPNEGANIETQKTIQSEIKKEEQSGKQPSYSASQFKAYADTLQAAMEGMGTDEDTIFRVINAMKSKIDMLKLVEAFGIRYYKEFAFIGENYNLGQWLQNEMSSSDLEKVNAIMKKNNVPYQF